MKIVVLVLSMLISLQSVQARSVSEGHENGNGGDAYAIEFRKLAAKIADHVSYRSDRLVNARKFFKALEETKVESTSELLTLNGVPKDALNFPKQKRIIFNRQRWQQIDPQQKPGLVLHEYLSIQGLEDADYALSTKLLIGFGYSEADIYTVENGTYICDMSGQPELVIDDQGIYIGFISYEFVNKWTPLKGVVHGSKGVYKTSRSDTKIEVATRVENDEEILFGNQTLTIRNSDLVISGQLTTVSKLDMTSEQSSTEIACHKK